MRGRRCAAAACCGAPPATRTRTRSRTSCSVRIWEEEGGREEGRKARVAIVGPPRHSDDSCVAPVPPPLPSVTSAMELHPYAARLGKPAAYYLDWAAKEW